MRREGRQLDRLGDDMLDLKVRVRNIEENLAVVGRWLDRLDSRVERTERRLDLVDLAR